MRDYNISFLNKLWNKKKPKHSKCTFVWIPFVVLVMIFMVSAWGWPFLKLICTSKDLTGQVVALIIIIVSLVGVCLSLVSLFKIFKDSSVFVDNSEYFSGRNLRTYYTTIPSQQLALQIDSEIKYSSYLYTDAQSLSDSGEYDDHILNAKLILLKDFLLVLPNDSLCHVIPVKDIAWVGPLKIKEEIDDGDEEKTLSYVCVFARDIVLYVDRNVEEAKSISEALLAKIPNSIVSRKAYFEKEFLQIFNEYSLTQKLENMYVFDKDKYLKLIENCY
jgi:hypothetical protein